MKGYVDDAGRELDMLAFAYWVLSRDPGLYQDWLRERDDKDRDRFDGVWF